MNEKLVKEDQAHEETMKFLGRKVSRLKQEKHDQKQRFDDKIEENDRKLLSTREERKKNLEILVVRLNKVKNFKVINTNTFVLIMYFSFEIRNIEDVVRKKLRGIISRLNKHGKSKSTFSNKRKRLKCNTQQQI